MNKNVDLNDPKVRKHLIFISACDEFFEVVSQYEGRLGDARKEILEKISATRLLSVGNLGDAIFDLVKDEE